MPSSKTNPALHSNSYLVTLKPGELSVRIMKQAKEWEWISAHERILCSRSKCSLCCTDNEMKNIF